VAFGKKDRKRAKRRSMSVRSRLRDTRTNKVLLPRVSVFRSLNNIYAQIIDDVAHSTVVSCSSLELKNSAGDKSAVAKTVGLELAKRALEKGCAAVMFDRGRYLYHGRVKALAEGLREGGLKV
jgi:large subunit ribosomal protein L18